MPVKSSILLALTILTLLAVAACICAFQLSDGLASKTTAITASRSGEKRYEQNFSAPVELDVLPSLDLKPSLFSKTTELVERSDAQVSKNDFRGALQTLDAALNQAKKEQRAKIAPKGKSLAQSDSDGSQYSEMSEEVDLDKEKADQYQNLVPAIYQAKGLCHLNLGEINAGIDDLSRAIDFHNDSVDLVCFENRALAYRKLGNSAAAAKDDTALAELMQKIKTAAVEPGRKVKVQFHYH